MIINDMYSEMIKAIETSSDKSIIKILNSNPALKPLFNMASEWGIDLGNVEKWMKSPEYKSHQAMAEAFIKKVPEVLHKIEEKFGEKLIGEVRLCPSLMQFDGFARYDSGSHTVWFGVDHPDADEDYLKVLMAHELSHVYRDHRPEVWAFLGKPLEKITRAEYLENMSAAEHLASEGLATLFSQAVFPEVPLHVHHYYFSEEMKWCLENSKLIEKAIFSCLKSDQNVWKFYEDDIVAPNSPSRVQYFWGALRIREWLESSAGFERALIEAHGLPAHAFKCFEAK